MTPQLLGFPDSFTEFRAAQSEAIEHALTSPTRFSGIGAPTGMGKSGIGVGLARTLNDRAVMLTANLGLMDQYLGEFGPCGMVDIRGRSNYPCWEGGNCEEGSRLDCKDRDGCPYIGALRCASASPLVVTNYAYWLTGSLKAPEILICDEAGLAMEWLSRSLDFRITERDATKCGISLRGVTEDIRSWDGPGLNLSIAAQLRYDSLRAEMVKVVSSSQRQRIAREVKDAELFKDRTSRLSMLNDNWVITQNSESEDGNSFSFECVWPGMYRERLFSYIPRVILMSATLRPKTLHLLGIGKSDYDFREWGRQFPMANGPVIWYPTVRNNHRMSPEDKLVWLTAILEIVQLYPDRNGLIQTVSFARAKEISDWLKQCGVSESRIYLNGAADPDSATARDVYKRFMTARPGSILISPSFSTGWDFKGKLAEFNIIAKIAFPDTRGKVMQARTSQDDSYSDYLAAQELVQGCGRVVRSESDRGTTYIVDDNWSWFGRRAKQFLPSWFRVRREDKLPVPLLKIQ